MNPQPADIVHYEQPQPYVASDYIPQQVAYQNPEEAMYFHQQQQPQPDYYTGGEQQYIDPMNPIYSGGQPSTSYGQEAQYQHYAWRVPTSNNALNR